MKVGGRGLEDSSFGNLLEQYHNKFDGFDTQGPTPKYTTPTLTIEPETAGLVNESNSLVMYSME
jgi:hypothetical protein